MRVRTHAVGVALTAAALAVPVALAAAQGFDNPTSNNPQQEFTVGGPLQRVDKPNDPDYDRSEDPNPSASSIYDERFDLFGFPSKHSPLAIYNDPQDVFRFGKPQISGFNAAGAWKLTAATRTSSSRSSTPASGGTRGSIRTQVHLNADELPPRSALTTRPTPVRRSTATTSTATAPRRRRLQERRARRQAGTPTGQDLIKAFSNGNDADGNGYVDDIAGWDFFDDDNDPDDTSSYFAARNHGTGRAEEAVEQGNDGAGELGVCPKCQFMPMRDLGHVRLRPEHRSRSGSSTRPTTASR